MSFEKQDPFLFSLQFWNRSIPLQLKGYIEQVQEEFNTVFKYRDIGWFYFFEQRRENTVRLDNNNQNVIWIDIKAKNLEYLLYSGTTMWVCRKNKFPILEYQLEPAEEKVVIQYLKSVIYQGHLQCKLAFLSIKVENPMDYLWEQTLVNFFAKLHTIDFDINNIYFKNLFVMYLHIEIGLFVHTRKKRYLKDLILDSFPEAKPICDKITEITCGENLLKREGIRRTMESLTDLLDLHAKVT